eukprot:GHVS01074373.1.p1 GENE.GHVS01074373.1~~GHVS01074373.1.p1  ORF type:complete len:221 (+),score=19.34 GHVS01074373.1:100-762(+)
MIFSPYVERTRRASLLLEGFLRVRVDGRSSRGARVSHLNSSSFDEMDSLRYDWYHGWLTQACLSLRTSDDPNLQTEATTDDEAGTNADKDYAEEEDRNLSVKGHVTAEIDAYHYHTVYLYSYQKNSNENKSGRAVNDERRGNLFPTLQEMDNGNNGQNKKKNRFQYLSFCVVEHKVTNKCNGNQECCENTRDQQSQSPAFQRQLLSTLAMHTTFPKASTT